MTRTRSLCNAFTAAFLAACPALAIAQSKGDAQTSLPGSPGQRPVTPSTAPELPRTTPGATADKQGGVPRAGARDAWERAHRSTRIVGTAVRNPQGEKIGEITDLVLDDQATVAYAVISTGGFLGIGDRLHAVPWRALQTRRAGTDHFVLDIDKARLATAPGFDSKSWPDFSDARWRSENRKHFPPR